MVAVAVDHPRDCHVVLPATCTDDQPKQYSNEDEKLDAETKAAISAGKARLEALTTRPRAVASLLSQSYDNAGAGLTAAQIEQALRDIISSDPDVFGACVAFQPGVFNGEARRSFYACRESLDADGDDTHSLGGSTLRSSGVVSPTASLVDVDLDEGTDTAEGSDGVKSPKSTSSGVFLWMVLALCARGGVGVVLRVRGGCPGCACRCW